MQWIRFNVTCLWIIVLFGVCSSQQQAGCDINKRNESCPKGYCCARDEFLPELVYCKRIGSLNGACTTRPSESDCPCEARLYCRPNTQSASFSSLYGKCETRKQSTTPPSTIPTTEMSSTEMSSTETIMLTETTDVTANITDSSTVASTANNLTTMPDVFG